MEKKRLPFLGLYLLFLVCCIGCSTTKFIAEDAYLLDQVEVECNNPDFSIIEVEPYLRQQPNFKIFGIFKWPLYIYNWSSKNEKQWLGRQFRRIGEAPIVLDTALVSVSTVELKKYLTNKGYTNALIHASIDTSRPKKATVVYHIETQTPYRIRSFSTTIADQRIDSIIHPKTPTLSHQTSSTGSLIEVNSLFDRDILDAERQRIATILQNNGYFEFNKEYLAFRVDSSLNSNQVDVEMLLKPYQEELADGTTRETAHRPYDIKSIQVLTDYDPLSLESFHESVDTVHHNGIDIIYGKRGRSIRPSVLQKAVYMEVGKPFREKQLSRTYTSFAALRALRNVKIKLDPIPGTDSLNCIIQTTPSKIQSIGVGLDGTNSAGDLGFASSLNYQHRNLFKGSEVFSAKLRGAYESIKGMSNYWEFGADGSLQLPHFLFPFVSEDFKRRQRATTEFKLSYNLQTRPEYERAIMSGGLSYVWQSNGSTDARHVFKLIDIDFVHLPRIDQAFRDSLPPSTVLYNYSDQFIVSMGYTYSRNTYDPRYRLRNSHSIRLAFESAGNILYAISSLSNAKKNKDGLYDLLGVNYSQFLKADIDLAQGIVIDERNKIALHIGFGIGIPYGNASRLPFERRYFSGGANSVRGWSVRELGPGSMPKPSNDNIAFALQTGDIRLDANVEYRTKLFWKFELAAYMDAGNIWTIRPYEEQPLGNFDLTRFYKEIACSYGLGLRADFDFFLLRFDTGMKIYDPQASIGNRWKVLHPNLTDNFAWHFAVGYPF